MSNIKNEAAHDLSGVSGHNDGSLNQSVQQIQNASVDQMPNFIFWYDWEENPKEGTNQHSCIKTDFNKIENLEKLKTKVKEKIPQGINGIFIDYFTVYFLHISEKHRKIMGDMLNVGGFIAYEPYLQGMSTLFKISQNEDSENYNISSFVNPTQDLENQTKEQVIEFMYKFMKEETQKSLDNLGDPSILMTGVTPSFRISIASEVEEKFKKEVLYKNHTEGWEKSGFLVKEKSSSSGNRLPTYPEDVSCDFLLIQKKPVK